MYIIQERARRCDLSPDVGEEVALIGQSVDVVGAADIWGVAFSGTAARFRSGRQTPLYTFRSRVMAHYTPGPCVLATETDFLQAYEDVLEKYKGNFTARVSVCFE